MENLIKKATEVYERAQSIEGYVADGTETLVNLMMDNEVDYEIFPDLINIYQKTSDKAAFTQMFFELVGVDYSEYLQTYIDETTANMDKATPKEAIIEKEKFYKTAFDLRDIGLEYDPPLQAFVTGERWNGSLCPYFEYDEAMRGCVEIVESSIGWQPGCGDMVTYDAETDTIVFKQEGEFEYFVGEDITVDGESKHVYPVGARSWIWNEVSVPEITPEKMAAAVEAKAAEAAEKNTKTEGQERPSGEER